MTLQCTYEDDAPKELRFIERATKHSVVISQVASPSSFHHSYPEDPVLCEEYHKNVLNHLATAENTITQAKEG